MACENDKCEKYGMHHDYKDGSEVRKCYLCKADSLIEDAFFPTPWNPDEHPERTQGWLEFQRAMRRDPGYYLSDFL